MTAIKRRLCVTVGKPGRSSLLWDTLVRIWSHGGLLSTWEDGHSSLT